MRPLQLHRSLDGKLPPLALAIGNFDGIHLGHQAILAACREAASRLSLQPAAMTFTPLPREYFAKLKNDASLAPARLMSVTEKLAALSRAEIRHAFIPRFDQTFAAQSPGEFMSRLKALNVKWLMIGEDFRFGAKRMGDVASLHKYGMANGFVVETLADIEDISGARISSTAIRTALCNGDLETAQRMLGRPYSIIGRVIHGKKLGRTLGFPTANISLTARKPALAGVFAVKLQLCFKDVKNVTRGLEGVVRTSEGNDDAFQGVANLGTNPVVSIDNHHHLEVFLFDFSSDLYGKRVQVTFIERIRDEQNFSGPDALRALVKQMRDDCDRAKTILQKA